MFLREREATERASFRCGAGARYFDTERVPVVPTGRITGMVECRDTSTLTISVSCQPRTVHDVPPGFELALRGFCARLTKLDVVKDRVTSLKTRRCGFESHLVNVRTSSSTDRTLKIP